MRHIAAAQVEGRTRGGARTSLALGILRRAMVLGLSAFSSTFGLVIVFFVVFPALAQGLIAFAVAQALGERAENQAYAAGLKTGDDERV